VFLEKKTQDYLRDLRILPIFAPKFIYLRAGEAKKCEERHAYMTCKPTKKRKIFIYLMFFY